MRQDEVEEDKMGRDEPRRPNETRRDIIRQDRMKRAERMIYKLREGERGAAGHARMREGKTRRNTLR